MIQIEVSWSGVPSPDPSDLLAVYRWVHCASFLRNSTALGAMRWSLLAVGGARACDGAHIRMHVLLEIATLLALPLLAPGVQPAQRLRRWQGPHQVCQRL